MNCSNCQIMKKDVPCIPAGNDFKIAIALKEIIKADGEVSERDINIKDNVVSVAVIKPNGDEVDNTQNVYSSALNGSTVIITFDKQGKNDQNGLPKGKYGIEVTGKRTEDSSDFCFSLPPGLAFEIVADSAHGYFPSDSITTYTVSGVVGVAQQVGGGGGGGEANVIETVKVNGTALTVTDKSVNVVVPTKTSDLTNDSNFLTAHQDISGKENRMQIVEQNSLSFQADMGKYYRVTQSGTISVTLPSVQSDYIEGFLLFFTAAADDCLSFVTQDTVNKSDGFEIKAGDICEVNAVHNGGGWQVTVIKFNS